MFCFKFLGSPRGSGDPITKIGKGLIQNGCPNPHRKFHHSSSIKTCLKIGLIFGEIKAFPSPCLGEQGDQFQHAPSLTVFRHASWQGIRRYNFDRSKVLIFLANDLSNHMAVRFLIFSLKLILSWFSVIYLLSIKSWLVVSIIQYYRRQLENSS